MATLRGFLDNTRSPVITIAVSAPSGPPTFFDAVIDTGFVGFVQVPEPRARELGLIPRAVSEMQYADGRIDTVPLAWGTATLGSDLRDGFIHMQRGMDEAIVGVDFLLRFRKMLVLSIADELVLLLDSFDDLAFR